MLLSKRSCVSHYTIYPPRAHHQYLNADCAEVSLYSLYDVHVKLVYRVGLRNAPR